MVLFVILWCNFILHFDYLSKEFCTFTHYLVINMGIVYILRFYE
jgi:hypothetical protein